MTIVTRDGDRDQGPDDPTCRAAEEPRIRRDALRSTARSILIRLGALFVLAYALLELSAFGALRYLHEPVVLTKAQSAELDRHLAGEHEYVGHDPVLGWSILPGGKSGFYEANEQGIRAKRAYAPTPPPGVVRIAAYGDSFTHGDEVAGKHAWPSVLESMLRDVEVLNYGVPAYGPGQALLRYRKEGPLLPADIVLIGYMSENLHRAVNVFRPYYHHSYSTILTKPRFEVRGEELALLENPLPTRSDYQRLRSSPETVLPRLGENDYFYQSRFPGGFDPTQCFPPSLCLLRHLAHVVSGSTQPGILLPDDTYNEESEAFSVTQRILQDFYEEVEATGAQPVIVLFPNGRDLQKRRRGKPSRYQALRDGLTASGMRWVDVQDGFDRWAPDAPKTALTGGRWRHYTPRANRLAARAVRDFLVSQGWVSRAPRKTKTGRPLS